MKNTILAALLLLVPAIATAEPKKLNLNFTHLESRAEEVVDVTLDGKMLKMAAGFLTDDDPDEAKVRQVVNGLAAIYVRSFTFASDGAYSAAEVERVRSQLGNEWRRIVNVKSRDGENVEIYMSGGDPSDGMVVIAAEPRELTIVQLLGVIDLEKLADLDGQLGIPELNIERQRGN